jgi:C1A family cysteine protease
MPIYKYHQTVTLKDVGKTVGTGWMPSAPDFRDLTPKHPDVAPMVKALGIKKPESLPDKVDLSEWCSEIEDQENLGSCTAHAGVGAVEYLERRAFNKHIDGSRLFVYKATRNLMEVTGDTGAWLRDTMASLTLCGVPPEKYYPYVVPDFDNEPPSFVYAVADNFEAMKYFSHDASEDNTKKVLESVKTFLAAGVPSMFGFYGFPSFDYNEGGGQIPFPCPDEGAQWGHAILAVGYDNKKKIKNTMCNKSTTGALLIRNSWGVTWGDEGYGWLPYQYVLGGIALDFWSLLSMNWVNTKHFGL